MEGQAESSSAVPARIDELLRPIHRPTSYLRRGVVAASYPLRGIWYFACRSEFHPLMRGRLLPLAIISALVYVVLFMFAFLPQLAILAIWQGKSAWVNTIVLVLGEGLVIIQVRPVTQIYPHLVPNNSLLTKRIFRLCLKDFS